MTFRGQPLYPFSEDSRPHAVSGDELTDSFGGHDLRWHVVTVDDPALR